MREWQRVKGGIENAGEKCGTTGNKREYKNNKMRDLIATTARRLERNNTDDVLSVLYQVLNKQVPVPVPVVQVPVQVPVLS